MSTKQFDFTDFNRIKVDGAFGVDIVQADKYSIEVDADDFGHVRVEKVGDALRIGRRGFDWMAPFHGQPHAMVHLPGLSELTISSASHGRVQGFQSDKDLVITVSGASRLELNSIAAGNFHAEAGGASSVKGDIKAGGDVRYEISGASRLELKGTGNNAEMKLSGASHARLDDFTVTNCDIDINGASNAQINASGKLNIRLTGASKLEYKGNPTLGDVKITGASTLSKM